MTRTISIRSHGGPSALETVAAEVGKPGTGEVKIIQDAIGVNYVDMMARTGLYPVQLPAVLGFEAAGTVTEVGPGVAGVSTGDRVAYFFVEGAYATERVVSAASLIRLPADISNEVAATFLAKGLTAWMGLRAMHHLKSADTVLVLGASGSVGSMISRWATSLGATVIGVAGSSNKLPKVAAAATHAFPSHDPHLDAKIKDIAPAGVDVVYDLVGQATFALAAASVRKGGVIAAIGAASGQPSPTGFGLAQRQVEVRSGGAPEYVRGQAVAVATAELWDVIRSGIFSDLDIARYPFDDAARVHADWEQRRLNGLPVLIA
ncbi:zinc-binding dehydrogenase [Actinoalloteichus hymeniacidonis]|uniref:Zn-dependent oxidoreductase, NADPH:quinone reductase n=1 Tax=Actinoalloteichus hymeniacidonis TaxID=340345 RepID=A0AAC9HQH9_9PSEU|nr:zinc-binding dehydrogenase [Actinoalloteichus hymeniacidonis]AOS63712.1 Zn-dependent oxidoreductase, NADPH:quinone reductase [Actinoalloteichus hymeniacidonis]MBB5908235.1 NADPH2:quinone reductase [Actinoalloteichus hymeniacidonis]